MSLSDHASPSAAAFFMLKLIGVILVCVISLFIFLIWFLIWSISNDFENSMRQGFSPILEVGRTVCFSHQPGLLESSVVAIFEISATDANRVAAVEPGKIPEPQQLRDDWPVTGWTHAGTGFDMMHERYPSYSSRALYFLQRAINYTDARDDCDEAGTLLKSASTPIVAFVHPEKWALHDCDDSCLALLIYPEEQRAVAATFD